MIQLIHHHTKASIRQICEVLELPRSSYYQAAKPSPAKKRDEEVADLIEKIFRRHERRYGYRRIWKDLHELGIQITPNRVRRLMRERGLKAFTTSRLRPITSDGEAQQPAPNRLKGQALPAQPNRVWAGDITYLRGAHGWLYLAVVIDLASRRIVGWHLSDQMGAELVSQALDQAIKSRQPQPGQLIFHSDRGSQYASHQFRDLLQKAGIEQSMSARANPYDNAWTESFIGTLKRELIRGRKFTSIKEAQLVLFEYLEAYYNTKRRHSSLGYQSPSKFERARA